MIPITGCALNYQVTKLVTPKAHSSQQNAAPDALPKQTLGSRTRWETMIAVIRYCTLYTYLLRDRQPMSYIAHVGSDGKKLGQLPPSKRGAAERRTRSSRAKVPRGSPANKEQQ